MDNQPGQVNVPISHSDTPGPGEQPAPGASGAPSQAPQQPATLPPVRPQSADTAPLPNPSPDAPAQITSDTDAGAPDSLDQDDGWQYSQEADAMGDDEPLPDDLNWTASEFVEHKKGAGWYGLLALAGLVLAAIDYLVTKDVVSTGVIVIAAVLFGIYAGHKPRTQQYHLSPQGLQIGEKLYTFKSFKAFSVTEEAGNASIMFTPLARFAPALTIYVGQEMEDQVLDYLSEFLPFEKRKADAVDGLLRRIRF